MSWRRSLFNATLPKSLFFNGPTSASFLFIYVLFSLQFQYHKLKKSIDGMLGIRTRGAMAAAQHCREVQMYFPFLAWFAKLTEAAAFRERAKALSTRIATTSRTAPCLCSVWTANVRPTATVTVLVAAMPTAST